MPVQAIMLNATCELRAAFLDINSNKKYEKFKADEWSINITLTPKVDTQIQGMFGHTGKSTTNKSALEYITWTLGASPGLRLDLEGHRDGAVSFPIQSRMLLKPKDYPLFGCQEVLSNSKALSQYLGIREWLERIIPASGTGLSDITHVDKPSFSTQIIVKFDAGNAGPTFFVPNGSTFSPTLAALRKNDQTLSITMTPDPNKEPVQTFPEGAIKTKQAKQEGVSPAAQSRLDQIQLERTIQNLRIRAE